MKSFIILSVFLLAGVSGEAMAVCGAPATRVGGNGQNSLSAILQKMTVCGYLGNESWHEYHATNGNLTDIKKGPTDTVDPTKVVGSWSINSSGNGQNRTETVIYDYGTGGAYEYQVWLQPNGTYDFCGATTVPGAILSGPTNSVPTSSPC
jgi:hypothetical protein